jgi:uncharacterized protein
LDLHVSHEVDMRDRKGSRFNIAVPADGGDDVLLFNSATRALLRVDADTFAPARGLFHGGVRGLDRDLAAPVPADLDPDLADALDAGGFLVPVDIDEVAALRGAYERARHSPDLSFTIGLTMACNFACPYCFEEHRPEHLTPDTADAITAFVAARLDDARARSLYVNWFGGEPLLNADVLVALSARLRDECQRRGVDYASMAVTNGALLTRPLAERLVAAGVARVQVTLDGPPAIHDARRPFKGGQPSFARIVANLKAVVGIIAVVVRVNVDRDNHAHVRELVRILGDEGLLGPGGIERVYAGKLTSYTEQVRMVGETFAQRDLVGLDAPIRDELTALGLPPPAPVPTLAARHDRGGCTAVRQHSFVIGPQGHLFKCELGIHDVREAVGVVPGSDAARAVAPRPRKGLPVVGQAVGSRAHDWDRYNPFDNAKCSSCQFAPLCKGGCPKRILEDDVELMQQTCDYWDHNIERFVRELDA